MHRRRFVCQSIKTILAIGATGGIDLFATTAFAAQRDIRLRFALFSDGHYGQKETDYDAFHRQMVDWLNAEHQGRGLDFVIANGDLVHDDALAVPALKQHLDRLHMPLYPNHGNHDHMGEADWQAAFGQPYNYVVEQKDCALLFLNTADATGNYVKGDTAWMAEQLTNFKSKRHLFVVMHITPFTWTKAGFAHPEMVALFSRQKNLKAIFHGHDHDEDGWKVHDNKPYFFDGHTGGNWGLPYKGYRVVEVLRNGTIHLYQKNPLLDGWVNEYRV